MKKHQVSSRPKSPKFKSSSKNISESAENEPEVERCRSTSGDNADYFGFSFGKNIKGSIKS